MTVIAVEDLRKEFTVKRKQAGLRGSLRALVRPDTRVVEAVRDVTFALDEGEMLAFIGPNGAGKSTTIKMLTGILYPTSGQAQVLGYTPWKQRRKLAFHIGSVFGQKPQLWYHLPPVDTYHLFARIYELQPDDFRHRMEGLVADFEIGELIHTPVRKLSLGQRMKCEIVASLLHNPRILFLDEPTIGLDVIAKQQIRDTIRQLNAEERTTIFLTSHDADDVETLCKRVIVINHGQIIFDDRVSTLKRHYLTSKVIDVRFVQELDGFEWTVEGGELAAVEVLKVGRYGVKLQFDTLRVPVDAVIQRLMALHRVADITISDPPMEKIIARIYESEEGA